VAALTNKAKTINEQIVTQTNHDLVKVFISSKTTFRQT
jgi:hypothetical protein